MTWPSIAMAQGPVCQPNTNTPACQAPAVNFRPTDILLGQQANGPTRANQTVSVTPIQIAAVGGSGYSVLLAGAKCDGVTDDTVAIQAALNGGHGTVTIPANAICYSATGVTIPNGTSLTGLSFQPPKNAPSGSEVLCAANVSACVNVTNASAAQSMAITNLTVATNATVSPASGACININAFRVLLENVAVFDCYNGIAWNGTGSGILGGYMLETYAGNIAHNFIVDNNLAELYIVGGRMGTGPDWGTPHSFISFEGDSDSLSIVGMQFEAQTGPAYFIAFENDVTSPTVYPVDIRLTNIIFEASNSTAIFWSDGSAETIARMLVNDAYLNAGGTTLFSMNGTRLMETRLGNNFINVNQMFDTTPPQMDFAINDSKFFGSLTLNSTNGNSLFDSSDVYYTGAVSFAGTWLYVTMHGGSAESLTNSISSGSYDFDLAGLTHARDIAGGGTFMQEFGSQNTSHEVIVKLDSVVGNFRDLQWRTGNVPRWQMSVTGAAESGGNAGSDFELQRANDAGTLIDAPFTIARSNGAVGIGTAGGTSPAAAVNIGNTGSTTTIFGALNIGSNAGVSCSGSPTSSFASINGIVTHC